jgi:type II secretory pathway component PulF
MRQFRYEAKKGRDLVKGILSAETKDGAIDKINEMGLVPVELIEEKPSGKQSRVLGSARGSSFKGGGGHAISVFYRQLGRLLKSGVPLLPALALVAEQSDDRRLQPVLETIKNQVRQGRALAEAMAEHPKSFNAFAIAMIELGENTGHLEDALKRLADCYEKQSATVQKVKNALTYPAFVVMLGGGAFIFLLAYVVPKFSKLFSDLGQTLPLLTRGLIGVSEVVQQYGWGLLLIACVLVIWIRSRLQTRAYRLKWDRMKMELPLCGKLIFMAQFAIFARSMEILVKGGVPLLKALRTGIPAVSNEAMKEDLSLAERRVEQGATLSESLKSFGTFPLFAVHLILIGEQTGRLEQSFGDIADWYDQEVEDHTRAMTQLIEPVTILVIGVALGIVAIAILLPVFSMDAIIS